MTADSPLDVAAELRWLKGAREALAKRRPADLTHQECLVLLEIVDDYIARRALPTDMEQRKAYLRDCFQRGHQQTAAGAPYDPPMALPGCAGCDGAGQLQQDCPHCQYRAGAMVATLRANGAGAVFSELDESWR